MLSLASPIGERHKKCQRSIFVAICICAFSSLSTNQRPRFSPALAWRVTGAIQIRRVACFSASAPRTSRRRARPGHSRGRGRADAHTPERTFTSTSWRTSSRSRRRSRRTATTSPTRRRRRSSASPSAASSAESADELALSWDAFRSSNAMKVSANPTAAAMEAFRSHFERYVASKRKTSAVKTPQAFYYDKPNLLEALESGGVDTDMVDASLAAITPGRGGNTPGAKTSAARAAPRPGHPRSRRPAPSRGRVRVPRRRRARPGASAFAKRPAPGAVKTELNAHLPAPVGAAKGVKIEIVHAPGAGALTRDVRYMRDRISDRVDMLEQRLVDFAAEVERRHPGLKCGGACTRRRRMTSPSSGASCATAREDSTRRPCSSKVRRRTRPARLTFRDRATARSPDLNISLAPGSRVPVPGSPRVSRDPIRSDPFLADASVLFPVLDLQVPSRRPTACASVSSSAISPASLFPGQIVCVQGQNPSGHCLVARRVVAAAPPPMPTSPVSSPAFGALSMAIASGPFTCAGDLAYEPFDAMLAHCASTRPDVVVLLGPFVDAEHKTIRGEDDSHPLEASFEEVFAFGVRDRLEKFLDASADAGYAPSVVLMPSTRDATTTPCFRNLPFSPTGRWRRPRASSSRARPTPGRSP